MATEQDPALRLYHDLFSGDRGRVNLPPQIRGPLLGRAIDQARRTQSLPSWVVDELVSYGKACLPPAKLKETVSPLVRREFGMIVRVELDSFLRHIGEKPLGIQRIPLPETQFMKFLCWGVNEGLIDKETLASLASRFAIDEDLSFRCELDIERPGNNLPIGVQFLRYALALKISRTALLETANQEALMASLGLLEKIQRSTVQAGIWLVVEAQERKGLNRLREAIDALFLPTTLTRTEEEMWSQVRKLLIGGKRDFEPITKVFQHRIEKQTYSGYGHALALTLAQTGQRDWPEVQFQLQTVFPFLGEADFAKMTETLQQNRYDENIKEEQVFMKLRKPLTKAVRSV